MLGHEDIYNMYKTNFILLSDYNMSLSELDDMIPLEREIYIYLWGEKIKKENKKNKENI